MLEAPDGSTSTVEFHIIIEGGVHIPMHVNFGDGKVHALHYNDYNRETHSFPITIDNETWTYYTPKDMNKHQLQHPTRGFINICHDEIPSFYASPH